MSDLNEPDWNEIVKILNLLFNELICFLDDGNVKAAKHFTDVSEYEIALEIILLLFIRQEVYPQGLSKGLLIKTVKELGLNSLSFWDDNFWDKFCKWIDNFPVEK